MTQARALLALSHAPGQAAPGALRDLTERARAAARRVTATDLRRVDIRDGLVLLDAAPPPSAGDGRTVVRLSLGARTHAGEPLDDAALTARLGRADPGGLDGVAPPFGACLVDAAPGAVVAGTDPAGLRHVYWLQAGGWAALSTSSLMLALLAGADFDEQAVATFALAGNHVGEATPFAGVRLLPAGAVARLAGGSLEVRTPPPPVRPGRLDRRAAVAAGVKVVRELTGACLRLYPGSLLELSGGLDSRMLLAAVPPGERAGLRAATIGPGRSADHRIAAALAGRYGLEHARVTLDGIAALAPEDAAAMVEAVALARDCGGNPVALAVLDWQDRQLDQGPRLSGQNGEFARGFYYAGQRDHPRVSDDLVHALARWRVFTNDACDPALFAAGFLEDMEAAALATVRGAFTGYGGDWLAATDEFYLRERMRRWVGIAYSSASTRRIVQAPFFCGPYVDWARACAPADKRGSRLFAEVLAALDPELARLPLDSGRSPRAIAAPSPLDRLAAARTVLRKAARKVDQRVRRRTRPAQGTSAMAAAVQRAWARQPGALEGLASLPFLDQRAVEESASGQRRLNPASVGLLVDLHVARRLLARA